jgi:hypothetical protein
MHMQHVVQVDEAEILQNNHNLPSLCVQVLLGGVTSFMCMGEEYYPAKFCNATLVILQVGVTH